jgi:transcription elongation GreA/GreB family factor
VDKHEADAMRRLISEETPLARALLGHRAQERVQVLGRERRTVMIISVDD